MNLSKKLITLSVTLAIVPMTIITLISVYSLLKLNGNAVDNGRAAAKVQALNMLENIVAVEVRTVKDHIDRLSVIVGYLAKSDGVVLFTTLCDDAKDVKKDELQFALQSVKFNMQYCYATNFIETKQGRKTSIKTKQRGNTVEVSAEVAPEKVKAQVQKITSTSEKQRCPEHSHDKFYLVILFLLFTNICTYLLRKHTPKS